MEQKFNVFEQSEMPTIMLCTPNLDKVHAIDNIIFGTKVILRYNALSEFNFSIPESIDGNATTLFVYDLIKTKKYLHIEDIGYFIIQDVDENDEGLVKIKEVKCESLEAELKNKKITNFERISVPIVDSLINVIYEYEAVYEGDYVSQYIPVLYENGNQVILSSNQGEGIINTITDNYIPNWTVDTSKPIPESLITIGGQFDEKLIATAVRGFKVSDSSIYSFLVNEVEKAFSCAVIFNKEERSFYFEDNTSIGQTNIFLSYDNLIKSSNVMEYSDEIATSLSCYGDKNISINYSNPLGSSKIFNFEYFKTTEWMSQDLIDMIDDWNIAIEKELNGTVGGDHPGQAWGIPNIVDPYDIEGRYLDILYALYTGFTAQFYRGYGYYYFYPMARREMEIAGQKRLINTVTKGSDDSKIYKTHVNFLLSSWDTFYPEQTDSYYYEEVHAPIPLQSGYNIVSEGFLPMSEPRTLRVRVKYNYSYSFVGEVTVIGTNALDQIVGEVFELDSTNAYSGLENITPTFFKTITNVYLPTYYTDERESVIIESKEVITPTVAIPVLKRLNNIYLWSTQKSYDFMKYHDDEVNPYYKYFFNTSKGCIDALKKLESGETYSYFVENLFKAYDLKYSLDSAKTSIENMIEEQEILKAAAIVIDNTPKRQDHAVNITFLKEFFLYGLGETDIPSTTNGTYTLNSDENILNEQSMVDAYLTKGTTSEGVVVDYYNGFGGLNSINSRIYGVIEFIYIIQDIMSYIANELTPENYFGTYYSGELAPFIIENTYQNEYAVNYSGEIKDKIATSIELYNQSLGVLERISSPRYEFKIDLLSFINLYEYKDSFTKELSLGKKIRINIKNSIIEPLLLELEYSFDDLEQIDMTFGNRLRLDDVRFQYTDFVGQIYKVGSNLSFDKNDWNEFTTDYKSSLNTIIENPTDNVDNTSLINLESVSPEDQTFEISITKAGLLVRKRLDEQNYDPKKLLLTNGTIAYTIDDWENTDYIN